MRICYLSIFFAELSIQDFCFKKKTFASILLDHFLMTKFREFFINFGYKSFI